MNQNNTEKEKRRTFNPIERLAFWEVYNKKCFYCQEPIEFVYNMEMDHLVPFSLSNKPQKLKILIDGLNLFKKFEINAYYNFVPACKKCNPSKKEKIFPVATYLFYFEISIKKQEEIKKFIEKFTLSQRKSKAFAIFQLCVAEQQIHPKEMLNIIDLGKEFSKIIEDPIILHFGNLMDYSYENSYAMECDRLHFEIEQKLRKNLKNTVLMFMEDARSGEGFTLRYCFWSSNHYEMENNIKQAISNTKWEILEPDYYKDLFPNGGSLTKYLREIIDEKRDE
jgi:hypothetical protein